MTGSPRLCIGTVQFGQSYGITNQSGQVKEDEVRRILSLAANSGIEMLDTAQAYGTAETIVGSCWPKGAPRKIISKLRSKAPEDTWEKSFEASLNKLKTNKLDTFLLHRAHDLLDTNGTCLMKWLKGLQSKGQIERIGVSIYDESNLDSLPLEHIQVVQLPLSIYDQRLLKNGTIDRLKNLGIAVHVRSIFLQGLLLKSDLKWPLNLSFEFRKHHRKWLENLRQHGSTPIEGALRFIKQCQGIEAVLVGVLSTDELREVLQVWEKTQDLSSEPMMAWGWDILEDIDPRRWTTQ